MELGVYTFGDVSPGISTQRRLTQLVEEIELADKVGLDVFGVGEHHRDDYAVSSPAVVLAAGAARTERIRLTSAVTVLSSDDPVRVFQDFATLDLLSGGRAEIMAGRGSFIESFPLFGYDLDAYDELFEEKLQELLEIRKGGKVTWAGSAHTKPIPGMEIFPKPIQDPLPLWIAVGGTPNSVARAAYFALPLMIAIIGGRPQQFQPLVQLYRDTAAKMNHDVSELPVGISSHGFIAETTQDAMDTAFPAHQAAIRRSGKERGWPPT